MNKGKVKWWNDAKGYGFLTEEGRDTDIFVHYINLLDEGFKTLAEDQEVEFDLYEGAKGLEARNVRKVK